jgi:protease-4
LGDLKDAIACAARLAELDSYRLKELPEQKDKLELLIGSLMNTRTTAVERELGPLYQQYKQAKQLLEGDRFQARMEFRYPL